VALAPAEVHPQEHLGPVGGLGPARAGADRHDRVLRVVLAREQEQRPLPVELQRERIGFAGDVGFGVGVRGVGEERLELLQVVDALLERAPGLDLVAQALRLADDLLCGPLVVPEPGLDRARVQLLDPLLLGGEVKDAPRSTGSARRGP
jgi:hypothetical protein